MHCMANGNHNVNKLYTFSTSKSKRGERGEIIVKNSFNFKTFSEIRKFRIKISAFLNLEIS